jgi:preprotein translocase subunit SecA
VAEFLPRDLFADGTKRRGPEGEPVPISDRRAHREIERAQSIIEAQNHRLRSRLRQRSLIVEFERRHIRELRDAALCEEELPTEVKDLLPRGLSQRLAARAFIHALDGFWASHLEFVEELREGIGLSSIGGRDPDIEYIRRVSEAYEAGIAGLGTVVRKLVATTRAASPGAGLSADSAEASRGAEQVDKADEAAFDRAGIDVPSSTWTYQVDEEVLPAFSLSALSASGNVAAALVAPLLLLLSLVKRLFGNDRDGPEE